MQLLTVWRGSFALYKPKNIKLFLLVTLKTIAEVCRVWASHFWFLLILYVVGDIFINPFELPSWFFLDFFSAKIGVASILKYAGLLHTTLYLSTRPSVELKTYSYFAKYLVHGVYIGIWLLLYNWTKLIGLFLGWGPLFGAYRAIFSLVTVFFIMFLLDSNGSLLEVGKSIVRAFKMFLYTIPICLLGWLLVSSFCAVIYWFNSFLISGISYLVAKEYHTVIALLLDKINFLLFMPIPASFFANVYIKQVYEHFGLYYDVKK